MNAAVMIDTTASMVVGLAVRAAGPAGREI
jgi:hypothetical protein